jgi:multidrug efflux system membrane fusion protein
MPRRRRFPAILIVAVAIAGVAAAGWWYAGQGPAHQQRQGRGFRGADGPVPVIAAAVRLADVPVYLDGVGTSRALNTVTVRPQVDGKLISVAFKEGQDVKKGDILARIDPVTYQAQFDQAVAKKAQDEALLANGKIDQERYARLVASNSVPKQQLDTQNALVAQYAAQVNLDEAAIENARAILGYTNITAPLDGRTGIRQVDEGNIVHASDATGVVVLTQLQPIAILFSLPQQQLGDVTRAQAKGAPLKVDAFGADNKTVIDSGTLRVVDNQVDQTTGTLKLKAEFPNREFQLWPGQFVNVRLLVNTLDQVVVAPTAAVQRGPNGTFAFVVRPDATVAVRPINVARQDESQAVIASGLEADDRVVTTGFARLTDGSKVTVTNAEDAPPPGSEPVAERPQRRRRPQAEGGPGSRRERRSSASTGSAAPSP